MHQYEMLPYDVRSVGLPIPNLWEIPVCIILLCTCAYLGMLRIDCGSILIIVALSISILSADAEDLEADQGNEEGA